MRFVRRASCSVSVWGECLRTVGHGFHFHCRCSSAYLLYAPIGHGVLTSTTPINAISPPSIVPMLGISLNHSQPTATAITGTAYNKLLARAAGIRDSTKAQATYATALENTPK